MNFGFPKLTLTDLYEMEFNLGYNFKCNPFEFEQADFFEFQWMVERLAQQKDKDNQDKSGSNNMSLESLFNG